MDKQTKSHYLLKGMFAEFQMKPQARLLNKMVGIKFKEIRLEKNITAEEVVDANKRFFSTIYDLYRFEKGIRTDVAKMLCLCKYYNYDINFLEERFNWKGKNDVEKIPTKVQT
jgi:transcriptional regulator with XRE-family HTH domain